MKWLAFEGFRAVLQRGRQQQGEVLAAIEIHMHKLDPAGQLQRRWASAVLPANSKDLFSLRL